ncbi:MAG TPA: peptide chain release factor N(5)-glutamine methyltransferase [candidate division Zixibacteria bacterium]|nr:peptide chain release factor N(5)-glutamine methyltransferase [candidate division Zixibacteria bacterium]
MTSTQENTLARLINTAAARLRAVGIDAGVAEAEIILCDLLDCDRLKLYLDGPSLITPEITARFEEILTRRETRYPLQYILGESWFYGRRFAVDERVMVPTPETELLCEYAIRFLKFAGIDQPRVLDVGCGSGVISVTVALEYPGAQITALDISADALEVAQANAATLGAETITFRESDLFSSIKPNERYTLILSNPPYIGDREYAGLPPEVKADPRVALTSGEHGMDIITRLVDQAPNFMAPDGRIMFEIGYDQSEKVRALVEADQRYRSIVIMKDLNDIDRLVILSPVSENAETL